MTEKKKMLIFTGRKLHIYNSRFTVWKKGDDILNEKSWKEWGDDVKQNVNEKNE